VRGLKEPSEIGRLAAPVSRLLDGAWRRMHWWVATMAVLYLLSGITIVKSDEVAVILRWGRLVGDTPALQQHGPGLLFALPRPVDRVVRVQVKHVWEVPITTLIAEADDEDEDRQIPGRTLNPLTQGYALTGDQNIVQAAMVARYRVKDPAEWALYGPNTEDVLRVEVTAAMIRSLGEMGVDQVLSEGRKTLVETAAGRAQAGLDAAHSGLELASLELAQLVPPLALASDFDAVQSAFINAETQKNKAQAFAQSAIPEAHAKADAAVQTAQGTAANDLAQAKGEAEAFVALDREYRANPVVVRERLYRDAVEKALSAASSVKWIPPPAGGSYNGFRVTIGPNPAGEAQSATASPTPSRTAPAEAGVQPGPVPPPPEPAGGEDVDQ
jgi:modulator of FtsH protease HflK